MQSPTSPLQLSCRILALVCVGFLLSAVLEDGIAPTTSKERESRHVRGDIAAPAADTLLPVSISKQQEGPLRAAPAGLGMP